MKFIKGFFTNENGTSSKRLVGITGAFALFFTLFHNSMSESTFVPSDSLVWASFALSATALGLTTIETVTDLLKSKNN